VNLGVTAGYLTFDLGSNKDNERGGA